VCEHYNRNSAVTRSVITRLQCIRTCSALETSCVIALYKCTITYLVTYDALTFHHACSYFPSQRDHHLGQYQIILLDDRVIQV